MFSRLHGMRSRWDKQRIKKIFSLDTLGLLSEGGTDQSVQLAEDNVLLEDIPDSFESLDDALSGLDVFLGKPAEMEQLASDIFNTSKVQKPVTRPDKIGSRIVAEDFAEFEPLFKQVQADVAQGIRKIITFKNYDIQVGRFYVLNGLVAYIQAMGEEFMGSDNKLNARMRVIFENGTESQMLRRAFGSSMYTRGGKIITEVEQDSFSLNNDVLSGSIYVLKSLSNNPEINNIKNLYKIGYTSGLVSKRIANAENEDTYLYAPVEVVRNYQIINVDAHKFETVLHHMLDSTQLQVEITAPNGHLIKPREWFVVSLNQIEDIINRIIVEVQK